MRRVWNCGLGRGTERANQGQSENDCQCECVVPNAHEWDVLSENAQSFPSTPEDGMVGEFPK